MNQQFETLFERVISLWPSTLDVSAKRLHAKGGATIPSLVFAHDLVRDALLDAAENELDLHMDWAIFTVLHQASNSQDRLVISEIDKEAVFAIFERNLKESPEL